MGWNPFCPTPGHIVTSLSNESKIRRALLVLQEFGEKELPFTCCQTRRART